VPESTIRPSASRTTRSASTSTSARLWDEDDCRAGLSPRPNRLANQFAPERIKTGHRLVEKEDRWIADQSQGQSNPLLHSFGELAKRPSGRTRQTDLVKKIGRPSPWLRSGRVHSGRPL
jgi:hypothetical protein